MKYPEHEKVERIQKTSQIIGDFLEWLENIKDYAICEEMSEFNLTTHYSPILLNNEHLLAEYFEINLKKLEQEKRKMIKRLKKENIRKE